MLYHHRMSIADDSINDDRPRELKPVFVAFFESLRFEILMRTLS